VLLIFGVRRRGYRMANVFAMCGVCHTPAAQAIARVKTFFTFFFIPLIPLGSKYRSTCTMCGASISLTKEQAEAGVEAARLAHAQAQAGTAPQVPVAPLVASAPAPDPMAPPAPPLVDPAPGDGPPALPGA
jgi:zinc-ribbon family